MPYLDGIPAALGQPQHDLRVGLLYDQARTRCPPRCGRDARLVANALGTEARRRRPARAVEQDRVVCRTCESYR